LDRRLVVPIALVRLKPKKKLKLHPSKVAQYEHAFERGDAFPPIEVIDCGSFYTIRDGRHRFIAQLNLGYTMIDVVVVRGGDAGVRYVTGAHACTIF
jgi:hypothetical protein